MATCKLSRNASWRQLKDRCGPVHCERPNIAHFEDLLARETDPEKRRVIEDLLARERQKLEIAEHQDYTEERPVVSRKREHPSA